MTTTYRTNGAWGSGTGSRLPSATVDNNFYGHETRIAAIEGTPPVAISIASITQSGNQITVHLTDSSTLGPFTVSVNFNFRGAWQPSTLYAVNDWVTANGGLYQVEVAHTSSSGSFDPSATDGMGHDLYGLLLASPANTLPTGGATGQVLTKSSGTDYAATWVYPLPSGGTTGQILKKNSSTANDASWENFPGIIPPTSTATLAGDFLRTVDGTSTNLEWWPAVAAPASNGSANQVLQTTDGTPANTAWVTALLASDIGTAVQAYDADLAAIAGLTSSADKGIEFTGSGTAGTYDLTTAGKALLADADAAAQRATIGLSTIDVGFVIDGGGSTLTTGMKGYLGPFDYAFTITQNTLLADASGSIVVDIFKCTYAQFDAGSTHPVSGDKITASAPPTISSATKSQDATLTGWTTAVAAGEILAYNVNSVTSIKRVTITLKATR